MNICFKSAEGSPFAVKLPDYKMVVTYNYIYKTSSYKFKTQVHSRCKGVDDCWRAYLGEKVSSGQLPS